MTTNKNQRLLALDVMRGLTIAGMIMVNNPGSWSSVYAPLRHASWNGLTPTDLVFPFFMFIMGVSTYISLSKYKFEWSAQAVWKIVRRTLVIFAIGLGLAWLGLFFRNWHAMSGEEISLLDRLVRAKFSLGDIRILGVLQRLALSYGAAALIVLAVKRYQQLAYIAAALLVGYTLLLFLGKGFEYNETNLLSVVDRAVIGERHMYKDKGIEPEGLLSTIPSIAHVLIGFCCGRILTDRSKDLRDKILSLFLIGTVLTFTGFLLAYGCPINKKVWSPTFVLTTCGMGASLLALLVWIIDAKGMKKRVTFFEAFGVNPLFMYVVAAIMSTLLGAVRWTKGEAMVNLHGFIYNDLLRPWLGDYPASLAYALLFVTFVWACGYVLYKKKVYIKI
ncbi:MAG: heparan-alpha-glucosaminide N-acetyltransferase domain-containing protein [Tannerellaceae bacterium]|jgi:predicted acyltransferase|nr:heparan-alpha-glucosaminide N-acetyltransferase domain-containing protein [Tannerellaceae bacterium]